MVSLLTDGTSINVSGTMQDLCKTIDLPVTFAKKATEIAINLWIEQPGVLPWNPTFNRPGQYRQFELTGLNGVSS
jgi:hypothetical protein